MNNKIGNLKLKNRIFLAPMLEPNDIAFRLLCKKAGCGLTYTGMTSPLSKQKLILDDKPALQLFGNSTKGISSFMKKYDSKVSLWDFNLGCPSKLSKKCGHGAFMSGELETIKKILKTMRANTKKPLTIKMRKSDDALKILKIAEDIGVDAVCIHARTISQGYGGKVDYNFALKIKKSTDLPIIFSGDVNKDNIKKILEDFDFVMIGRAAIGNPGIFSNKEIGFEDYLKLAEKYKLLFRQIKYQAMNFTKGKAGSKKLRAELIKTKTAEEIRRTWERNK